ncbi:MAG: ATP-binding cassette domain-containing protein [Syntrophomonadaceae bacterium]|jgi:energy-coupling factor transport system ATP-binding protein|nr:ATP-binding cassette domain-containing protein [Syntrophomonadaceae bacterium]HAA09712.1 energy-coupling factor transporter ATPase [Syntrophomonas sp.]HQA49528.1 ATP-binding cassette domain-containing protein [Syntrophomonadaceae bacterium]HQD90451.1 ATP-binding cassette domain-containing protein [Syntrophomonadaceae bacterium]
MIRLDQVSFSYTSKQVSRPAVHNLSLTIEKGQMVAVVGANGSGKSTLARLINGSLLPDKGRVSVDGLTTGDKSQRLQVRSRVGLVGPVPDHQFVSNLVVDDVAFGPQNLGLSQAEINKRVDAALKMVSMEDYAQYPPYLLSGGQKQRVCLAGVLAMQPQYIILDEATSMLDPQGRRQIMKILEMLRRETRLGIMVITQNLEEVQGADRVIVMQDGQIAASMPFRHLVENQELTSKFNLEEPELFHLVALLKNNGLLPSHWYGDKLDEVVEALC